MSQSLSINNAEFNSVISEARRLASLLGQQLRVYDNVKNSLSGVEQSNRNNICHATNDLLRKNQDMQSKRDSLDEFIRTVTEFREDTNNTERNVASRFSSSGNVLSELNAIGSVRNVVSSSSMGVAVTFSAYLGTGHIPGTSMFSGVGMSLGLGSNAATGTSTGSRGNLGTGASSGVESNSAIGMSPGSAEKDSQKVEEYIAARQAVVIRQRAAEQARINEEELLLHQRRKEDLAAWEAQYFASLKDKDIASMEKYQRMVEDMARMKEEQLKAEKFILWEKESARWMRDPKNGGKVSSPLENVRGSLASESQNSGRIRRSPPIPPAQPPRFPSTTTAPTQTNSQRTMPETPSRPTLERSLNPRVPSQTPTVTHHTATTSRRVIPETPSRPPTPWPTSTPERSPKHRVPLQTPTVTHHTATTSQRTMPETPSRPSTQWPTSSRPLTPWPTSTPERSPNHRVPLQTPTVTHHTATTSQRTMTEISRGQR